MIGLAQFHGGQSRQIADRFGIPISELLDFSANINPDGPPATVHIALRHALDDPSVLAEYPDIDETELRQFLARYAAVRPENVAVANGFVPLLDAALRILPIRRCLVPVPAFVEYRRALERSRVEMVPQILTADSDFSCNSTDLLSNSCDSILLANPQNPSGILCSPETMLRIVEGAARHKVYIFLDEAFIDYCPDASLTREIDRFPNLIVFRSITKFFGVAGLRVAYAVVNARLREQLQDEIAPWSVTTLASLAAGTAVQDKAYVRHAVVLNNERRDRLKIAVRNLGIHVYPSGANFLLLRLPGSFDSQQFWERLIRDHHIVLRNCSNYEGLKKGYLRAAVRSDLDNDRLIEALSFEVENQQ